MISKYSSKRCHHRDDHKRESEELYSLNSLKLFNYGLLMTLTPTHLCRGLAIKEEKCPPTTTQTAQREKDNKWTKYQPALEVAAVTSTTDTR